MLIDDTLLEHFLLLAREHGEIDGRLEAIEAKLDRLAAVADLFESLAGDDGEPLSLSKLLRLMAGKGG